MTDRSMSQAICVCWPWQSPFSFLPTDFPYCLKPNTVISSTLPPTPQLCRTSLSLILILLPLLSLLLHSKVPVQELYKGGGVRVGVQGEEEGVELGVVVMDSSP